MTGITALDLIITQYLIHTQLEILNPLDQLNDLCNTFQNLVLT